jgi:DNA-binding beta-propeller fold protein YncE
VRSGAFLVWLMATPGPSLSPRKVDLGTGAVSTLAGTGSKGAQNGPASVAQFDSPAGLVVNQSNTFVHVVAQGINNSIRKVTISPRDVTILSISGVGNSAGIAVNPRNTFLYVAGSTNNIIYKV